ncbi:MAG: methyl-accepting chemotaxis protein [Nannocystaceae bacterium]
MSTTSNPIADAPTLEVEVLESSFAKLAPHADELVRRFYEELFERHPTVKPLFVGVSMPKQRQHLKAALILVVENLRNPGTLKHALHELGARHVAYGAVDAHYPAVTEVLLDVMKEVAGRSWTKKVHSAWADALTIVTNIMLEGASQNPAATKEHDMTDARSHELFRNLPIAAFTLSEKGTIESWNDAAAELTGRSAAEVVGKRSGRALTGKRGQTPADDALAEPEAITEAFTLHDASGQRHDVQLRATPILDADGEARGASVVLLTGATSTESRRDGRLVQAVTGAGTAFILIDRNFVVTYANASSIALLEQHSATFREKFSGFEANKLIGTCIDGFHRDPGRVRRLLNDTGNLPHTADVEVQHLTFELNVSAISDPQGELVGHCLEWKDVTRVRKDALAGNRLGSIIEGCQAMFNIVDEDMCITYVNPGLLAMLRRYEAEIRTTFPDFSVETLVGSCVDRFHRNPAHQRGIVADESRLPFITEIRVGTLEFGLTACALRDGDGNRIGTGLEWIDYNERAKYAGQVSQLLNACEEGRLSERGDTTQLDAIYAPMMGNINEMLDKLLAPVEVLKRHLGRVAEGDLTAYIREDYSGDHAASRDALNNSLDALNTTLGQVNQVAESVGSGSQEVSDSSNALSQGATEQASSLQQITETMRTLTDQTTQNAENATTANELSNDARGVASQGDEMMKTMVTAMGDIDESSQSIRKIIKVIDEIAFQTNLLALNAAVEAARAGVHGKGFAVVAEEVRSLAARSANAAKETTEMIEDSIKKVDQGANIAEQTASALTKIVVGVGKVTDLVAEIAAASNEQAKGISEINTALSQVDKVTQTNTASAEESAAASQELSRQAKELVDRLGSFTLAEAQGGDAPTGITPEMMVALQRMMVQQGYTPLSVATNPRNGARAAPPVASVSGGTPQNLDPASIIALDDSEFGKY